MRNFPPSVQRKIGSTKEGMCIQLVVNWTGRRVTRAHFGGYHAPQTKAIWKETNSNYHGGGMLIIEIPLKSL